MQTADCASEVRTPNILLKEQEVSTPLLYCRISNWNDSLCLDFLLLG